MTEEDQLSAGSPSGSRPTRSLDELQDSGILWLINRQCFHPRGFALALHKDDQGNVIGWSIEGDGSEPWEFASEVNDKRFVQVEQTLQDHRI